MYTFHLISNTKYQKWMFLFSLKVDISNWNQRKIVYLKSEYFLRWIYLVVVVLVVRVDCSDQMSRGEVIGLTYSSPLRVNVSVSAYFVQVQVQFAQKEFTECASEISLNCSKGSPIMLRRKCVLGSLPDVRSRESCNRCLRHPLFCRLIKYI